MAMTHSEFAQQAAYLAGRCSSWAGECAHNIGKPLDPMRDEPVSRFVAMLRETADMIDLAQKE